MHRTQQVLVVLMVPRLYIALGSNIMSTLIRFIRNLDSPSIAWIHGSHEKLKKKHIRNWSKHNKPTASMNEDRRVPSKPVLFGQVTVIIFYVNARNHARGANSMTKSMQRTHSEVFGQGLPHQRRSVAMKSSQASVGCKLSFPSRPAGRTDTHEHARTRRHDPNEQLSLIDIWLIFFHKFKLKYNF